VIEKPKKNWLIMATLSPFTTPQKPKLNGFTLIELLVVVAILAILLTVVAPSFQQISLNTNLKTLANEVLLSSVLARSEAIKRNTPVRLCVSSDAASCKGSGDWELGWIVIAEDDTVIKSSQAINTGYKISSSGGHTLTFAPNGASNTVSTMTVCRQSPSVGSMERVVTISATGRSFITKTTAGSCS